MAKLPVRINAHLVGRDTVYIEWFEVAASYRRRGIGQQAYETWERALPRSIKTIRLHAANPGSGPSDAFWEALGFAYRWTQDEIDDAVAEGADSYELEHEMIKPRTLRKAR